MSFKALLKGVATGSPLGVAAIVCLPVFGPVGAITAAGVVVGSVLGAAAGVADEYLKK